jgi:hypothetical protein
MADVLQLERIFRAHVAANPNDSRGMFPQPQIDPAFEVAAVLPPSQGNNAGIALADVLMLLVRVGDIDLPEFDLYYADYDSSTEEVMTVDEHRVQLQATLRLSADEHTLAWPLRRVRRLEVNHPPTNWQSRAILGVFGTANPAQCQVQVLTSLPDPGGAPDFCVLCHPPVPGLEIICRIFCG